MILSDYHIHTSFSSDSEQNPEDIVKKAISLGFKNICFTDHNDFDFPLEEGNVMFLLNYQEYIKYFQNLREKYKNSINICIGVEQGLMKSVSSSVNNYDSGRQLDFIIGSSHLVYGQDPYYPDFWDKCSIDDAILTYYESIIENLKCCDNFDVYGHLDYIIRYIPDESYLYDWHRYQDYLHDILKTLIENGKGIEINTAGLKYGLSEPNPCSGILKMYRELGGEIITIGSDAHSMNYLGYKFDIIPDYLMDAGFDYYTIFRQRKPEFIRL